MNSVKSDSDVWRVRMSEIRRMLIFVILLMMGFGSFLLPSVSAHVVSEKDWLNDPHDHGDAKIVYLKAYQFGFSIKAIQEGSQLEVFPEGSEPSILKVDKGDRVVFRIISEDVTHGFYIDGYSPSPVDQKIVIQPGKIVEVGPITFDRSGKFKIRCSVTCGPLHPFMVGDIRVNPNFGYYSYAAGSLLAGILTLAYLRRGPVNRMLGISLEKEVDLLRVRGIGPILKRILQWRGFHFAVIWPGLLIFAVVIVAGFVGNPVGNKNFSIAVVWILWFALVEFMILFAGRSWCTVCPLPALGEWIARRRLYGVHRIRKWFTFGLKWPGSLNNMWLGSLLFLTMSLIIPWLVTRPVVSGLLFVILISVGTILYITHPPRNFCRSICPAGAYIGHDSNASIYSVRSRDKGICDLHKAKECIRGSPEGYGCPWRLYPGGHDENTYCGQCYECLKSCPLDNMTVKIRMIGKDLAHMAVKAKNRFDEAWMSFIRFTLGIFYILVFFGPYAWIKDWGNMGVNFGANLASIGLLVPGIEGVVNWFRWAIMVAGVSLVVYPAIFYAFSWISKKVAKAEEDTKRIFLAFSYGLIPYIVFIWVAFAVAILLVFWVYPITAFSDPLGWGWNLLGFKFKWDPIHPQSLPYVLSSLAILGMALSINSTYNIAREMFKDHSRAYRATSVMALLHVVSAIVFVWVVAG